MVTMDTGNQTKLLRAEMIRFMPAVSNPQYTSDWRRMHSRSPGAGSPNVTRKYSRLAVSPAPISSA
jgi:hypothetical protein